MAIGPYEYEERMIDTTGQNLVGQKRVDPSEIISYHAVHSHSVQCERPPLGLMKENIWLDLRVQSIRDAIHRYLEVNKQIPHEWLDELKRRTGGADE